MSGLIVSHVWRPTPHDNSQCAYMNCRRPIVEHERAISGRFRIGAAAISARQSGGSL